LIQDELVGTSKNCSRYRSQTLKDMIFGRRSAGVTPPEAAANDDTPAAKPSGNR
jgi:hypothetical protein